jgi:hypothetical protein
MYNTVGWICILSAREVLFNTKQLFTFESFNGFVEVRVNRELSYEDQMQIAINRYFRCDAVVDTV